MVATIPGEAMADRLDPTELLRVKVEQLARVSPFVAQGRNRGGSGGWPRRIRLSVAADRPVRSLISA
jgi:hypothetical protein